ncbi:hypothetical protein F7734_26800 [Scytonema sp. UIC 10036]|nr:hypothetical protein [Scytonema sp. UIC 10036]
MTVLVQFDTLEDRENTYRIYISPAQENSKTENNTQENQENLKPPRNARRKGEEEPEVNYTENYINRSTPLKGTTYIRSQIENIPEQNTGDPQSLRDFIVWGIENYPAENYAVILWNHGTGWKEDDIYEFARERGVDFQATQNEVRSLTRNNRRLSRAFFLSSVTEVLQLQDEESRAIAFDDSSMDFLDNAKLQQAFQEAEEKTGQKVNLIGMDACLMSMVEVVYQLRTNTEYIVSSQEVEPMDGWPYSEILQHLTTHPETTPAALAKIIVQEYGRYYEEQNNVLRGGGAEITQSATNLAMIDKLAKLVSRLAATLRQSLMENDIYAKVALFDISPLRFKDKDFVDLYDYVKSFRDNYSGSNSELIVVLDELIDFIKFEYEPQLILANVASGRRVSRAQGLSIYLPLEGFSPFYDRSEFASCGWGDFIRFCNKVS